MEITSVASAVKLKLWTGDSSINFWAGDHVDQTV